jgi:hypothetical protein
MNGKGSKFTPDSEEENESKPKTIRRINEETQKAHIALVTSYLGLDPNTDVGGSILCTDTRTAYRTVYED